MQIILAEPYSRPAEAADVVSRFGGEEFIILLPQTSVENAARTAEHIRESVSTTTFPPVGVMAVSSGVAALADSGGNRDGMLRRADEAFFEAKRVGRNAVMVASPVGFRRYSTAD